MKNNTPIVCLTSYTRQMAKIIDRYCDITLVGDSVGTALYGMKNTKTVNIQTMLLHTRSVVTGSKKSLVVADMPFKTYLNKKLAYKNAKLLMSTGCEAVKLEGGVHQAETIRALSVSDIPVMAHVGMKPQSVRMLGGMSRIQRDREQLLADARAAEEAGAFAIVLELIPREIASEITSELSIPTIGIGAGASCDGQVLVSQDMLGLTDGFNPKFLKRYCELRQTVSEAVSEYADDVRNGRFPGSEHSHE